MWDDIEAELLKVMFPMCYGDHLHVFIAADEIEAASRAARQLQLREHSQPSMRPFAVQQLLQRLQQTWLY
jgi:hypothetical protein